MNHPLKISILVILFGLALIITELIVGCTSPLVEINRTGSALPDVNIMNGNDIDANGNTVEGLPQ